MSSKRNLRKQLSFQSSMKLLDNTILEKSRKIFLTQKIRHVIVLIVKVTQRLENKYLKIKNRNVPHLLI